MLPHLVLQFTSRFIYPGILIQAQGTLTSQWNYSYCNWSGRLRKILLGAQCKWLCGAGLQEMKWSHHWTAIHPRTKDQMHCPQIGSSQKKLKTPIHIGLHYWKGKYSSEWNSCQIASREKGGHQATEGCEMERRWEEEPEEEKNRGACIRRNKGGASQPRTGYLHRQDTLHLVYGQGPDRRGRAPHTVILSCPPGSACRLSCTCSTSFFSWVGGTWRAITDQCQSRTVFTGSQWDKYKTKSMLW